MAYSQTISLDENVTWHRIPRHYEPPRYCAFSDRHNCRGCVYSDAPELFDGGCIRFYGKPAYCAYQADDSITCANCAFLSDIGIGCTRRPDAPAAQQHIARRKARARKR